jgi:predicted transcriptional regulator
MNRVRRTFEIDAETDTRLAEIAAERGQDVATVLAEAIALFDSVVDVLPPDVEEDRRRLGAFRATGEAVPLDEVKAWVGSRDSPAELPRPFRARSDDHLFA